MSFTSPDPTVNASNKDEDPLLQSTPATKQITVQEEVLMIDFYGEPKDIEHFELIYNSICQRINHEVAIKCSYMMERLKSFSLKSSIGRILTEKEVDFKTAFIIPEMTDYTIYNLLIKQNFAISINVKGREEHQANLLRKEIR